MCGIEISHVLVLFGSDEGGGQDLTFRVVCYIFKLLRMLSLIDNRKHDSYHYHKNDRVDDCVCIALSIHIFLALRVLYRHATHATAYIQVYYAIVDERSEAVHEKN